MSNDKSVPDTRTVVMYGNAGGIANHRDNAVITTVAQLQLEIEAFLKRRILYGITEENVTLNYYTFDDRIQRHVWMLRGDRNGYTQQFIVFMYIDELTEDPLVYQHPQST